MRHPFPWTTKHGDKQHRVFDDQDNAVAICRSPQIAEFVANAANQINAETDDSPSNYDGAGDAE